MTHSLDGTPVAKRQPTMIDQIFSGGSYQAVKQMLDMTAQRQEALAGNIANNSS